MLLLIVLHETTTPLLANGKTKSVVLKSFQPEPKPLVHRNYNEGFDTWEQLKLIHEANGGDPIAQHELGLRYMMGEGFDPDTAKAAYWIMKAAYLKLPSANYNYGILLYNGVGVSWNPFEAYKQFQLAASMNMPQAQYMIGAFYTDNLTVPRNLAEAYKYFKESADSGFAPAQKVVQEFTERGWLPRDDSTFTVKDSLTISNTLDPASDLSDSLPMDNTESIFQSLIKDAKRTSSNKSDADDEADNNDDIGTVYRPLTKAELDLYTNQAAWGNPEALAILGWRNEQGISIEKDLIEATALYLQAMRYGSVKAHILLLRLVRHENYFEMLKTEVDRGNYKAQSVWAKLVGSGIDYHITEKQALQMLESAAEKNYPDAIVDLALCYEAGTWVKQNKAKAEELLEKAATMDNNDAKLRLISLRTFGGEKLEDEQTTITLLLTASDNGSQLAQEVLGYCYEHGFLVEKNLASAARNYRLAAQHGSQSAAGALKQLYDSIRPKDKEFVITE